MSGRAVTVRNTIKIFGYITEKFSILVSTDEIATETDTIFYLK